MAKVGPADNWSNQAVPELSNFFSDFSIHNAAPSMCLIF